MSERLERAMLTDAELAAIRVRDTEVIGAVRREINPNVWIDRHRLLRHIDALTERLADQREQIVGLKHERDGLLTRNRDLEDEIEIDARDLTGLKAKLAALEQAGDALASGLEDEGWGESSAVIAWRAAREGGR